MIFFSSICKIKLFCCTIIIWNDAICSCCWAICCAIKFFHSLCPFSSFSCFPLSNSNSLSLNSLWYFKNSTVSDPDRLRFLFISPQVLPHLSFYFLSPQIVPLLFSHIDSIFSILFCFFSVLHLKIILIVEIVNHLNGLLFAP